MKHRKRLYRFSILFCTIGAIFSAGMFMFQWREYRMGEKAYERLQENVLLGQQQDIPSSEEEMQILLPQVDFHELTGINPDVKGWLYCLDTPISYPICQGQDNLYYLNHLLDGTQNSAGCLFLDSACEGFMERNSVIYGHHMKNGTMFASLTKYEDQGYYDAHPDLFLLTPDGTYRIRLFSAYVAGMEDNSWQMDFASEADYEAWMAEIQARSCFKSQGLPEITDRVVTLSTCDYTFKNARFVCHGWIENQS